MEKVSTQLRKGFLQGILLILIDQEPNYGYGIMKKLAHYGLESVPKGTIYPLLTNMLTKQLLVQKVHEVPNQRTRKYYYTTDLGKQEKAAFLVEWVALQQSMTTILKEDTQ